MSQKNKYKKYFDIHGIVRVSIDTSFPALLQTVMHQLSEFMSDSIVEQTPDIIIKDYEEAPQLLKSRVIDNYYYYSEGFLKIQPHKSCFNLTSSSIIIYCEKLLIPINLLLHLAFLRKEYSLVHSAAFEFNGKRYLLAAHGGIGKTTLIAGIMSKGGKFFGDDLNIVNKDQIFCYPIDLSIYPYHMDILNLRDKSVQRQFFITKIFDKLTNKLAKYNSLPAKAMRVAFNYLKTSSVNVSPRKIFGNGYLAKKGSVDEIYFLSRVETQAKEILIKPIDPDKLAKIAVKILFLEWHGYLQYLLMYDSLSEFSIESMYEKTRIILNELFTSRPCYYAFIPISLSNESLQEKFIEHLANK